MNKKGGFVKFLLAGVLGAVTGLLFAPKTGKETRKEVKRIADVVAKKMKKGELETKKVVEDVFGNQGQAAVAKYEQVKKEVAARVAEIVEAGKTISKDKYGTVVDEVVTEFKSELGKAKGGVAKLAKYLKSDYKKVEMALKPKKRVVKKKLPVKKVESK